MNNISENIKNKILQRADCKCEIIKGQYDVQRCNNTYGLSIHHIKYKSRGGKNNLDNLILVCMQCHYDIHHSSKSPEWTKKYKISRYGG